MPYQRHVIAWQAWLVVKVKIVVHQNQQQINIDHMTCWGWAKMTRRKKKVQTVQTLTTPCHGWHHHYHHLLPLFNASKWTSVPKYILLDYSIQLPTYTHSNSGSSSSSPIPTIVHLPIRLYQSLNEDPKKNRRIGMVKPFCHFCIYAFLSN